MEEISVVPFPLSKTIKTLWQLGQHSLLNHYWIIGKTALWGTRPCQRRVGSRRKLQVNHPIDFLSPIISSPMVLFLPHDLFSTSSNIFPSLTLTSFSLFSPALLSLPDPISPATLATATASTILSMTRSTSAIETDSTFLPTMTSYDAWIATASALLSISMTSSAASIATASTRSGFSASSSTRPRIPTRWMPIAIFLSPLILHTKSGPRWSEHSKMKTKIDTLDSAKRDLCIS